MSEFADIMDGMADATSSLLGPDDGVTYATADGAVTRENVPATIGKSEFVVNGGEPAGEVQYISNDFLIKTADLVDLAGNPIEPKLGDTITSGGDTYKVAMPGPNLAPWGWTDGITQVIRRIHTKRVG